MVEEKLKNNTKIGIVVAMEKEIKNILDVYSFVPYGSVSDKKLYIKDNIIVIISGIGKVNAAISTQLLIDKYDVSKILNIGTCGGLDDSIKIGNVYSVLKSFQYDFDLSEVDNVNIGYMQDYDLTYFPNKTISIYGVIEGGVLASGDRFSNGEKDINTIRSLKGNLKDMEGASVAQTCYSNKVDCYIIKGVTDVYGSKAMSEQYFENVKLVSNRLKDLFLNIVNEIK